MHPLVKSLFPDYPEDRRVVETMDSTRFFKIDYARRILYIPTDKALRANLMLVDSFMDSVAYFRVADLENVPDWNDIFWKWDFGDARAALNLIQGLMNHPSQRVTSDIETRKIEYTDNRVLAMGFTLDGINVSIITCFTQAVLEALQQLLDAKKFTWQNGKFDTTRVKYLLGIDADIADDTMLMHYAGINEKTGTHGLKDLGALYLQAPAWDDELDKIKKQWCRERGCKLSDFMYDYLPLEVLLPYLAKDCVATHRLSILFPELMRPESHFIYSKLIEASNAFRRVELNGVYVDQEYMETLELDLDRQIVQAQKDIQNSAMLYWDPLAYGRATGAKVRGVEPFNYKSPKQLMWLLSQVVGRQLPDTRKDTLEDLFLEFGDTYPVLNAIKQMRKLTKYMDTYVQGFRKALCADGRIHATYNLHGTETGRLSGSEPNMQNIPRAAIIKNLIVAAPGKRLLQLDYSQAELRVLAYLSKDQNLTDIYKRGEDLHDAIATKMFGPNFTKEQRVMAKTINFGIAYGRGPASLVEVFGITLAEAKKLIDDWFAALPDVKQYIQDCRRLVYSKESPKTPFGRERHFVITYDKIYHIQNEIVNFAIQSIASDCTLFSLIAIDKLIYAQNLRDRAQIIISVHDSIVLEIDDDDELTDYLAKECVEIMASIPKQYLTDCEVPFKADVEVGYKWGELEKWN